jgi:AAA15 family ATPase/GTPase
MLMNGKNNRNDYMKNKNSITIENYRAIKKAEFSPNSINIFVGPNNCGKSSVLEAIAFNISGSNKFKDAIGNNIWTELSRIKKYDPAFLVYNNAPHASIKFNNSCLTIETIEEGFPEDSRGVLIKKYFDNIINEFVEKGSIITEIKENYYSIPKKSPLSVLTIQRTLTEISESLQDDLETPDNENYETLKGSLKNYIDQIKDNLMFEMLKQKKIIFSGYLKNDIDYLYVSLFDLPMYGQIQISDRYRSISDNILRRFLIEGLGSRMQSRMKIFPIVDSSENLKNKIIINLRHSHNQTELSKIHDEIIAANKITQSIENLREKIQYFQDIRKTDEGLQIFLNNQNKPLPITSMGDGFCALLKLTLMNDLIDDGIILLEEPEISLHPGFLSILCEAILANSKESQFFITTHSIDFITNILKIAEWNNQLDDVQIIRMHTRLEIQDPDIEILTGKEAKEQIEEIGIDLRGI